MTRLAGLLALAAATGCSNHGPVGIFSPELFGRNTAAPQLGYYSAAPIAFITYEPIPQNAGVSYGGYGYGTYQVGVTLSNTGGSGTYGPVQVTFSSTDPKMQFQPTVPPNNPSTNPNWVPTNFGPVANSTATAVSSFNAGSEILAFSGTSVFLEQGYYDAGAKALIFANQSYSFEFYYNDPNLTDYSGGNSAITVPINMAITDGFNYTYNSTFDISVTQE